MHRVRTILAHLLKRPPPRRRRRRRTPLTGWGQDRRLQRHLKNMRHGGL